MTPVRVCVCCVCVCLCACVCVCAFSPTRMQLLAGGTLTFLTAHLFAILNRPRCKIACFRQGSISSHGVFVITVSLCVCMCVVCESV
jgi:hypothetical protein